MTRIVSYNLYACPICGQPHLNPNYGSISGEVPYAALLHAASVITCQRCYAKSLFSEYEYLETLQMSNSSKTFNLKQTFQDILFKIKRLFNKSNTKSESSISIHDRYP